MRVAWILLLTCIALPRPAVADCATGEAVFKAAAPQVTRFRDYEIRLYRQADCEAEPGSRVAAMEILQDGTRVHVETGYSFALGYPLEQDQPPDSVKAGVGADFTGAGPGLLISEWSGGAHCCYTFHVFELGAKFKALPAIPVLDADESAFVRRRGVEGLVLSTVDYSAFAYFPKDFADSPAGRVFLSFDGQAFRPNLGLMKTSAPRSGETAKCAALFRQSRSWKHSQPIGIWYYATDLIYTGNEAEAWRFLDAAWGGKPADRQKYLDEYRSRLGKSVYHQDLVRLQKTPPTVQSQVVDWTKHCFDYLQG